jgi:hypothetical protein
MTSANNAISNAVSVVSAAQLSTWNAVSNEISVRAAASADLKSAINVVSNATSVVSAAQLSTWNKVSAILTSSQSFTGSLYTFGNVSPSANITYNLGSTTARWLNVWGNTLNGTASTAQYADLAEKYLSDADYEVGTVVIIGGKAEVTQSGISHDNSVLGVVSGKPAYLMNSESTGATIALTGRVPCRVKGPVRKGDVLVTSNIAGRAETLDPDKFMPGCILGKALEGTEKDLDIIEIVVGIH